MSGKEGINGGFAAVETIDDQIPNSVLERQEKRQLALRAVQAVSSLAGNEIPILPAPDAISIPQVPGVYLFPDYDDPSNPIIDTVFHEAPSLLSGRADSAHSVLTGELESKTATGETRRVDVAVKCSMKRPADESYDRAINELSIMSDLYQMGELGFKPIALVVSPDRKPMDGKLVMVSRFDGAVNTMDNLPWGRGIDDPANVEAAIAAAAALGRFNAVLGYRHDDAKIKNVATRVNPIQTGMIDFETTEKFDPDVPAEASTAAHVDFERLVDSIRKKRFFHHPKAKDVLDKMAEAYLMPWLVSRSEVFNGVYTMVERAVGSALQQKLKYGEDQNSPDS